MKKINAAGILLGLGIAATAGFITTSGDISAGRLTADGTIKIGNSDPIPLELDLAINFTPVDSGIHQDASIPDSGVWPDAAVADSGTLPTASCVYPGSTTKIVHYCPNGNDNNDGSISSPKATMQALGNDIRAMKVSTQFLLCRGGSWPAGYRLRPLAQNDANGNIIHATVGAYGPVSSPNPVVNGAIKVMAGDPTTMYGNISFFDLTLRGTGDADGNAGFFYYNSVTNVDMCNVDVRDFNIGVQFAMWGGKNFILRESYIADNHGQGVLGAGIDTYVLGNIFKNNGYATGTGKQGHNMYISGGSNILVQGNTSLDNGHGQPGKCTQVVIAVHGGTQNRVRIINNTIKEVQGTAQQGCWGIAIDAASAGSNGCIDCEISNNHIENVGNVAIALQNASGYKITGNTIIHKGAAFGTKGIAAPSRPPEDGASVILSAGAVSGNTLDLESGSLCFLYGPAVLKSSDNNTCAAAFFANDMNLTDWQATGFDANSTFTQQ